ncbi:MAG: hypothetical protein CMM25_02750 [Rhodospirillaceae bacterium]|jgi:hypothetical protein|nr:hypothetical protein [Rhodospirillaceae bacterium]
MASRTYYASQALGIYAGGFLPSGDTWGNGTASVDKGFGAYTKRILSGVQSVGFSSSVEFEQIFELGHLQIFENIEGSPTCEMTIERVLPLDGFSLFEMFHNPSVTSYNDYSVNLGDFASDRGMTARLTVQSDGDVMTNTAIDSTAASNFLYGFQINGFTSNYSISAQTDGAVTESLGVAGVDLIVLPSGTSSKSAMVRPGTSTPRGVFRRQDLSVNKQKLVNNELSGNVTKYGRVQSASISVDVGREDLLEMGRKGPYIRYASFPVEVTMDVEYNVDTGKDTVNGGNFQDGKGTEEGHAYQTMVAVNSDSNCATSSESVISINGSRRVAGAATNVTCSDNGEDEEGGVLFCMFAAISGAKMQSQSWSGGDTGGGVVTISESYTSFNALRVHSALSTSMTPDQDRPATQTN